MRHTLIALTLLWALFASAQVVQHDESDVMVFDGMAEKIQYISFMDDCDEHFIAMAKTDGDIDQDIQFVIELNGEVLNVGFGAIAVTVEPDVIYTLRIISPATGETTYIEGSHCGWPLNPVTLYPDLYCEWQGFATAAEPIFGDGNVIHDFYLANNGCGLQSPLNGYGYTGIRLIQGDCSAFSVNIYDGEQGGAPNQEPVATSGTNSWSYSSTGINYINEILVPVMSEQVVRIIYDQECTGVWEVKTNAHFRPSICWNNELLIQVAIQGFTDVVVISWPDGYQVKMKTKEEKIDWRSSDRQDIKVREDKFGKIYAVHYLERDLAHRKEFLEKNNSLILQ